jgi:hypothetical protein
VIRRALPARGRGCIISNQRRPNASTAYGAPPRGSRARFFLLALLRITRRIISAFIFAADMLGARFVCRLFVSHNPLCR